MSNSLTITNPSSITNPITSNQAYCSLTDRINSIFHNSHCNKNEFENTSSAIKILPFHIKKCIFTNMNFSHLIDLLCNLDLSITENIEVKTCLEDVLIAKFRTLFDMNIDKTNLYSVISILTNMHNHFISQDKRVLLFDNFRTCQNAGDLLDVLKSYSAADLLNLTCYFTFVQDLDEANMCEILLSMLSTKYSKETPKSQLKAEKLAILLQIILKTSLNFKLTHILTCVDKLPFVYNSIKVYKLLSNAVSRKNIEFTIYLLNLIINSQQTHNIDPLLTLTLNDFIVAIAVQDLSILQAILPLIPTNMVNPQDIARRIALKLQQFIGVFSEANLVKPREGLQAVLQHYNIRI